MKIKTLLSTTPNSPLEESLERRGVEPVKKRAFLVFGPEGSGTRLFTRILISSGCKGDATHRQRYDGIAPVADTIVWRKSFPHNNKWPSITKMVKKLRKEDYAVYAFVTTRDWYAILQSRGPRHGAYGGKKAVYSHLQKSYPFIFQGLKKAKVPFIVISYEEIIAQGESYVSKMLKMFGLELQESLEPIIDGNAKYYEEA